MLHACSTHAQVGLLVGTLGPDGEQADWLPQPARWGTHLAQMRSQLEQLMLPEGAASLSMEGGDIGWSVEAAAAMAPTADLTTRGWRRVLRDANREFALHYM